MIWQDIDLFLRTWIQDYRYRVCFDHKVDLHYRKHPSLSRVDFFQREKLESRCRVIRDTVSLMLGSNKDGFVRETRFLVAETAVGAARSGQHDLAKDLLNFSASAEILNQRECKIIRRVLLACRTGIWRWGSLRNWLQNKLSIFHVDSQLGQVDCSEPLIQTTTHPRNKVQQYAVAGA